MPSCAATDLATGSASPVIITTSMPMACAARARSDRDSSRISSASANAPDHGAVDQDVQH